MLNVRTQNITIVDNITGEDVTEQYYGVTSKSEKEQIEKAKEASVKKIYKRLSKNEKGYLL